MTRMKTGGTVAVAQHEEQAIAGSPSGNARGDSSSRRLFAAGCLLLAALGALAYAAGLSSPFLFDDYAVLPALGAQGRIRDMAGVLRFITSGTSDPLGRPLTLLTFLLNARDWPAATAPFKATNIALHLANGVLVAVILRKLGTWLPPGPMAWPRQRQATLAALLAAAYWAWHPFFVSTTLYVVQREAILACTFVLLGILAWLRGRALIAGKRVRTGTITCVLAVTLFTPLAALCKANGVLLPAFILVTEFFLLQPQDRHRAVADVPATRRVKWLTLVLLALPSACIFAYLAWRGVDGIVHGIGSLRGWTLDQRLMTEPRVLVGYLHALVIPGPFNGGPFNDQVMASTSLIRPWSTLPAFLAITALAVAPFVLRRRWPEVAFAIAFFLVGHALESSTIALELSFDHRNYLPAVPLFWPLASWLARPLQARPGEHAMRVRYARGRLALAIVIGVTLLCMTGASAQLWSRPGEQAMYWAASNPDSARAQVNAAQWQIARGEGAAAIHRLEPLVLRRTSDMQVNLSLIDAYCTTGSVPGTVLSATLAATASSADPGMLISGWFDANLPRVVATSCHGLDGDFVHAFIAAGLANRRFSAGRRQDLVHGRGQLALLQGDAGAALLDFNAAVADGKSLPLALAQAALLGQDGFPAQGVAHLDFAEAHVSRELPPATGMPVVHAWLLARQHYWEKEEAGLRATLLADMHNSGNRTPP
jgi:hypothetical protein